MFNHHSQLSEGIPTTMAACWPGAYRGPGQGGAGRPLKQDGFAMFYWRDVEGKF